MRAPFEVRIGRQPGQAIVIVAFMILALFAGVGLAIDAGSGYFTNTACERAAAAAALSGVVFMPLQFASSTASPAGSRNDATDRALDEAKRNGFDPATQFGTVVTPAPVAGFSNKLQVTVQKLAPVYFMTVFGIGPYPVSRTAIATYLPPLSLGQPGQQLGSTVSQLGSSGFYILRVEGWNVDRGQGDAFSPNPNKAGCGACPSSDLHILNGTQGTDTADASLPVNGGYNYRVTVPAGTSARIQVYNAAFAPDGGNFCENYKAGAGRNCSPGGSYHMHEDDGCCWNNSDPTTYSAMEYTVFQANSVFIRASDVKLSQMKVLPIDATQWNAANNQYTNVNTGATITQTYNAAGAPTNMNLYHSWIDVATYTGAGDGGLVSYTPTYGPLGGALAGNNTYRLRIDPLNYDGTNPPGNSGAHKGYAVRVTDAGGVNPCATCTLSAIDDMAIYTPISTPAGGGNFKIPLFQLPPDYAGKTIGVDLWDVGDMSGSGSIYMGLIDPRTNALLDLTSSGTTATIYNLHQARSNYGTGSATLISNPAIVEALATNNGSALADNNWYHFDVPIPVNYNPGVNPNNWWWSLQYRTTSGVTATDTITVALFLKGNPAHLLQS